MNLLHRLPKSSVVVHRYRIASVTSQAAYSICCSPNHQSFQKAAVKTVSFCYVPKRHKSFTESFADIYTGISHSTTVSYFQNTFVTFHDVTGLPWWATIIVYTVGLRLIMFPVAVYGQKVRGRLRSILEKELPATIPELRKEVAVYKFQNDLSEKEANQLYIRSFNKQYDSLIQRDNCHPMKTTVLLWFQIPVWICHSIGIRNILTMQPDPNSIKALITYTQLTVGGCLWIPNLVETDASYILPVLWCITNLMNIELTSLENVKKSTQSKVITNLFRLVTVAVVPIAASVPSALPLYWCTSAMCALGQNLVLMSPRVKRICGIPASANDMDHPYRTIAQRFLEQMKERKTWCTSLVRNKP